MNDLRLTLTSNSLIVHGPTGERTLSPEEAARVRDMLDAPGLPWWLEYGSIAAVILAAWVMFRGGGA